MVLLKIKQYREKAGLSQAALALLLDIAPEKLRSYEEGEAMPSMDLAIKIAHVCHTTTDELFGLSPDGDRLEIE